ncbi:MAG: hypothetical protein LQ337_004540 [Flavoplaca oasis]|nr:MAG: hypothetical protein LQ337_004540 [Flavoplaca oasis]
MSHPVPPPPLDLPPARSTTDPPSKHRHHQHHHIHRPHRSQHHGHRDKSVPQSAILPTSTSNLFKSESSLGDLLSPLTKVGSRFESHHSRGQSGSHNDYSGAGAGFGPGHDRRLAQEEADDVLRRERETSEERERELWKEVERKRSERGEADESVSSSDRCKQHALIQITDGQVSTVKSHRPLDFVNIYDSSLGLHSLLSPFAPFFADFYIVCFNLTRLFELSPSRFF